MEASFDEEGDVSGNAGVLEKYREVPLSEDDTDDIANQANQVDMVERKETDGVPKDHGWAWFVLLGATLEMLLQLGISKSAGILFVAFQEKFYSSSSATSLLSTVQSICQSIMGFLVMTCGIKLMTYRNLMFLGSVISSISYIITSQATDIRVLLFSHGVLQGIAVGIALPAAVTMVSLYFEKRRGLANSIAVSGGAVGGIIFASLITNLLSAYGYQGCVLILAGILLNGCVSGALFRSISFYTKQINRRKEEDVESQTLFSSCDKMKNEPKHSDLNSLDTTANIYFNPLERNSISASVNQIETLYKTSPNTPLTECEEYKQRSYSVNDVTQKQRAKLLFKNTEKSYPSIDVEVSIERIGQTIPRRKESIETANGRIGGCQLILNILSESFNFKILTNPLFLALLLQGSFISSGTIMATTFIVPYARDINVSAEDIVTLVTTQSSIDLFTRIIVGYISDKGWLRRSTIVAIASMIVSVSSGLIGFYTSYNLLLGYSIILGLVSGIYFALYTVVLIDYLTLANFQTCFGFMALVHGFSIAGAFYLVGYLRDISGSYVLPHQVTGAVTGVGAIIMYLLPVIQRLQKQQPKTLN